MSTTNPGMTGARADAIELLNNGELSIEGRVVDASNATFYCAVHRDGQAAACVYKPIAGERPLWDFPDGTLAQREVAAYEISEATGWGLVPPTVLRDDLAGSLGERLGELLTRREMRQTKLRLDRLLSTGRHPEPCGDWPPVPWPPI